MGIISKDRIRRLAKQSVTASIANKIPPARADDGRAGKALGDLVFPVKADEPDTGQHRLQKLSRALRDERRRGRAGHWSYDLNRHLALAQAIAAEQSRIKRPQGNAK